MKLRRTLPQFFAENDVAAVRYGPSDDPDALLDAFLQRRLGEGHDVLGILQHHVAGAAARNRAVAFDLVPTTEWPSVEPLAPSPNAPCSSVLPELAARLAKALNRRPDVVVLNRFGRAECEGEGVLGALAAAVVHDIPILIATPEAMHDAWTQISCGLSVTLRPNAASLDAWWRSLGYGPRSTQPRLNLCEQAK